MTAHRVRLLSIAERLGIHEPWVEQGGVAWLTCDGKSPREVAAAMHAVQARFITITTHQLPAGEGFRLEYHWDLGGLLLGFVFLIAGNEVDSIFDLCEAADWVEREVHEEYALEFLGREYEPLLLRQGDAPGVYLREEVG